jgi:Fe-S oxidoreductase
MNVCANFQSVGGHAFGGEFYTGGIGGAWTAATQDLSKARFAELCTGCSRCVPNCPVEIDIPYLNTVLKERLLSSEKANKFQKYIFGSFAGISEIASVIPKIYNRMIKKKIVKKGMEKTIGFEKRRPVPKLAEHTLTELYKNYSLNKQNPEYSNKIEAVLLADVFTNFNNPEVGISLVSLFEKLGVKLVITEVKPDGRSYVSQGLIKKAKAEAEELSSYLSGFDDRNIPVIVAEPSVLAMLRYDYQKLIDKNNYEALAGNSYDPFEYIVKNLNLNIYSNLKNYLKNIDTDNSAVFYHGHCQLKSIGADLYTVDFLRELGFKVFTSDSECCGMAGSFGYKKDFYELSKNIGMDLIAQIDSCRKQCTAEYFHVLASGTSCREQINDLSNFNAVHPIVYADKLLNGGLLI